MTPTRENFEDARAKSEDVDSIIDSACRIKGVELAALIKESASGWNCSVDHCRSFHVRLVSKSDVDVSQIAAGFGGSGDEKAAGFFTTADLPEIKDRIISQFQAATNGRGVRQVELYQTGWIESTSLTSVLI